MRQFKPSKKGTTIPPSAIVSEMNQSNVVLEKEIVRIFTVGGPYEQVLIKKVVEDFEDETGIRVIMDIWTLKIAQIRAMVEARCVTADLLVGDPWSAVVGCNEGLLEHIDPSFLGDLGDMQDGSVLECGIGTNMFTVMFAWDKDRTPKPPTDIAGFFDVKKYPGKRALSSHMYPTFEYALMADGVANKDIYKVLGGSGGVERALTVLEPMKGQIVWWDASQLSVTTLANHEVAYSMVPANRYFDAVLNDKRNWDWASERLAYAYDTWFVPKGAPNRLNALKYLAFMMQPERLGRFAGDFVSLPSRKSAVQFMDQAITCKVDVMKDPMPIDVGFWADHIDDFGERFQAWRRS